MAVDCISHNGHSYAPNTVYRIGKLRFGIHSKNLARSAMLAE